MMPTSRSGVSGMLAEATLAILVAGAAGPQSSGGPRFEEISDRAGVRFTHATRKFRDRPKAEVLEMFTDGGAAVAAGDFDGDGFDDLFLVGSDTGQKHQLLRNRGDFTFEEMAEAAGVAGGNDPDAICADALWLDYDNDGDQDLLVARFGTPLLYRNDTGEGPDASPRFVERAAAAGLTTFANTIAVIAFDADADGWLDLLFGNYFPPRNLHALEDPHVLPNNLDDADNGGGVSLWRNVAGEKGERRFVDVTVKAGLAHHTGWSLDLGHADYDNDGDQDVYVAGDYGTDRLFANRGDGTFEDRTEAAIGFDTKKGMNVDFADYDRDGWLDVYVTNITDEYMRECNMLWQNQGDGTLIDVSRETGTCDTDWGWAAKFTDFDNDGWIDLYAVNGLRSAGEENYIPVLLEAIIAPGVDFSHIETYPDIGSMTWSGYQKQRFFVNRGDGTFAEAAAQAGLDNDLDGRGLAVADYDRDGRPDIVQTNANQPTLVFRNVTAGTGSWLALDLVGTASNRDAIGARVTVVAGGQSFIAEVNGGNGYSGQSSLVLHFGLGKAGRAESVRVRWPSGVTELFPGPDSERESWPVNRRSTLVEGEGTPLP